MPGGGQHQKRRDHQRDGNRGLHDRVLIDLAECRAEQGDEQRRGHGRSGERGQRASPFAQLPAEGDAIGEDVRAWREARHRDEQRVAFVRQPAARPERPSQQLHRRMTAQRAIDVVKHEPGELLRSERRDESNVQ